MSSSEKFSKIFNDNLQKGYLICICMMIMLIIITPLQRTAVIQLQLTGLPPFSSFCPSSLPFEARLPWLESSQPVLVSRSSPSTKYWPRSPNSESTHLANIFFQYHYLLLYQLFSVPMKHSQQSLPLYAVVSLSANVHSESCSSILFSRPNEG